MSVPRTISQKISIK